MFHKMKKSIEELKSRYFWRAVFAELLGTTMFVFFITTIRIVFDTSSDMALHYTKACLAIGFSAAFLLTILGPISGGYINPSVTCGAYLNGDISCLKASLYSLVQYTGGILGAGITWLITPSQIRGDLGVVRLGPNVTLTQGFMMELVLTFVLTLCVLSAYDKKKPSFGPPSIIIGFAYISLHFVGIEYTSGSMNPARAFGPAVVMNYWDSNSWLYWVAPYVGSTIASLMYRFLLSPNGPEKNKSTIKGEINDGIVLELFDSQTKI